MAQNESALPDKPHVTSLPKCGFCQADIFNEKGLKPDSTWMSNFGCWLCHFCYIGWKLNREGK